jgi:hypothetical protein
MPSHRHPRAVQGGINLWITASSRFLGFKGAHSILLRRYTRGILRERNCSRHRKFSGVNKTKYSQFLRCWTVLWARREMRFITTSPEVEARVGPGAGPGAGTCFTYGNQRLSFTHLAGASCIDWPRRSSN